MYAFIRHCHINAVKEGRNLVSQKDLYEAVEQAKEYISCAIEAGKNLRIGQGNGPLWHFPFPTPPVNEG